MIVVLGRNKDNQPTLSVGGDSRHKIISEADFKKIEEIINSNNHSESADEYILRTFILAEEEYPTYEIGEHIIYVNQDKYKIGIITRVSELVKCLYFVDFNNGEEMWLEAKYLHKIDNGDTYLFLV